MKEKTIELYVGNNFCFAEFEDDGEHRDARYIADYSSVREAIKSLMDTHPNRLIRLIKLPPVVGEKC